MHKTLLSKGRLFLTALAAMALALAVMAQASFAAIAVDAKDFTEPVEDQVETAVPIVIGFLAVLFGLSFLIRWIQRRANSAK